MGLSIPTRQEPRKALYVSPLADPLIAASGPEETMETSLKKDLPSAPQVVHAFRGQAVGSSIEASQESCIRKADEATRARRVV